MRPMQSASTQPQTNSYPLGIESNGDGTYRVNGRRVPGVTTILETAGIWRSDAPEHKLEAAAERGLDVHLACADLDSGGVDWWSEDEMLAPYIAAYKQFKADFKFKPISVEEPFFNETLLIAGRPDRIGTIWTQIGDQRLILDLKATYALAPSVEVQLAGYKLLTREKKTTGTAALHLKKDASYRFEPYGDSGALETFVSALNVARWADRHYKLGLWGVA